MASSGGQDVATVFVKEKAMALATNQTERTAATTESVVVRYVLTGFALVFLTLFLFVPLVSVFWEALAKGWDLYLAALTDPEAVNAIKLTLITALIAVPLNLVFGVAAAWAIARFEFRGKALLTT